MTIYYIPVIIISIYMLALFCLASIQKNNSIVDVGWGLGFVMLAIYTFVARSVSSDVQTLVTVLTCIWGLRLSYHIFKRNRGKGEDFRYKAWRDQWGKWFYLRSFFQIYVLQGVLLLMIAAPIIVTNTTRAHRPFDTWAVIGLMVWIIGFLWESVGDAQLRVFIKNPKNKGKIMMSGLWRYTRHPNYFGEAVMWWGIWLLSLSTPGALYAIVSPLTITILLRFVSGVPMLEKKYEGNLEYEAYKKVTNAFIPGIPRVDK